MDWYTTTNLRVVISLANCRSLYWDPLWVLQSFCINSSKFIGFQECANYVGLTILQEGLPFQSWCRWLALYMMNLSSNHQRRHFGLVHQQLPQSIHWDLDWNLETRTQILLHIPLGLDLYVLKEWMHCDGELDLDISCQSLPCMTYFLDCFPRCSPPVSLNISLNISVWWYTWRMVWCTQGSSILWAWNFCPSVRFGIMTKFHRLLEP